MPPSSCRASASLIFQSSITRRKPSIAAGESRRRTSGFERSCEASGAYPAIWGARYGVIRAVDMRGSFGVSSCLAFFGLPVQVVRGLFRACVYLMLTLSFLMLVRIIFDTPPEPFVSLSTRGGAQDVPPGLIGALERMETGNPVRSELKTGPRTGPSMDRTAKQGKGAQHRKPCMKRMSNTGGKSARAEKLNTDAGANTKRGEGRSSRAPPGSSLWLRYR